MSFEDSAGLGVNNFYGPRSVGGVQGVERTAGIKNEASVNFDGDALDFYVVIPAGAVVTGVDASFATGAVATAVVGVVDVSGASTTPVAVPLGGDLVITGPTAGSVLVYFNNVA